MGKLIEKIREKFGANKLVNADEVKKNSPQFVSKCVIENGASEFQHASKELRSNANFILHLVKIDPAVLQYCEDTIYDSYLNRSNIAIKKETDLSIFAIKCCEISRESVRYMPEQMVKEYYESVKRGKKVKGKFRGEPFVVKLKKDAVYLRWMELTSQYLSDEKISQFSSNFEC